MKQIFLNFEQPIAEIEARIEQLRSIQQNTTTTNISEEIKFLTQKSKTITKNIYSKLSSWQVVQIARHPQRPYTLDYIKQIFTDFHELHGDRIFGDDKSIIGGIARFNGKSCIIIGHQKGRNTKERTLRNFGMSRPEGYRKAARLMRLAEKFHMPLFTFVDTPGAYPGISAEEHCQSEAIGRNLYIMAELNTPIITTIIGEGGSGGALAIAIGDNIAMLQFATYSVISPEGYASILWKNILEAPKAAEALGLTASYLKKIGLIDQIIKEPIGGAHRDPNKTTLSVHNTLTNVINQFQNMDINSLLSRRYTRLKNYGKYNIQKK